LHQHPLCSSPTLEPAITHPQQFIVPQAALEAPYQEKIYGHKAEDRALFNQPPLATALSRNDSGNAF